MRRRSALRILGTAGAAIAGGTCLDSRMLTPGAASPPPPDSSREILKRSIPSSGESLPVIGLGTWQTFDVGQDPAARAPLEEVLAAFVGMGGKLVDSSPMYGRSEQVVGEIAAKLALRPKLFIATKVWTSGKKKGIEQMQESMRKLRADPIDLMQVHNLLDVGTQLDTLEEWKRAGRVRYFGVTHYTAGAHEDLARVISSRHVDFVQVNYSAGEREAERRLLPLARERGVAVIANRPFAAGDLLQRLRSKPLPAWAAEIDCTSWAQVLLKFVVSHPAVTCAIPATSKVEHLRDDLKAGYAPLPDPKLRARMLVDIGI